MKQDNTEKIREMKWEERWEGDKKGLKMTNTVQAVMKAMMKEEVEGGEEERGSKYGVEEGTE